MEPMILGLGALGLLVCLVGEGRGLMVPKVAGKLAASTGFLLWAWHLGLASEGRFGVAVVVALVLSFVGDMALLSHEKKWFLAGLVAFLLAHVGYAAAFVILGVSLTGVAITAVPVAAFMAVVWAWLGPHTGSMRRAVIAYVAVIGVMVTLAGASAWLEPSAARLGLLISAVIFMISDLFVARQRFVHGESRNRYIGLPLYYAAQFLFGSTAAMAVAA